jgi:glutaminyl-peptide cyclotransferase
VAGASEAKKKGGDGVITERRRVFNQFLPLIVLFGIGAGFGLYRYVNPRPAETSYQLANGPRIDIVSEQRFADAASFAPKAKVDADKAMQYVKEMVAFGRRAPGSSGYKKTQDYLRAKLAGDQLQEVPFTANTPAGKFSLINFVAKFPGTKDGIIVIASHYETNYPLKDFVGANDPGSSAGLLLAIADQLRGKKNDGPSIWLAFFDGEEAFDKWSDKDSLYGSKDLAARWKKDGTAKQIKAFVLLDMIGDADLNIDRDANSTRWLADLALEAAKNTGNDKLFFNRYTAIEDDHVPFAAAGVPVLDLIDLDYGPNNSYHHSPQDTVDKLSAKSMQVVGDATLELIRLLNQRN